MNHARQHTSQARRSLTKFTELWISLKVVWTDMETLLKPVFNISFFFLSPLPLYKSK